MAAGTGSCCHRVAQERETAKAVRETGPPQAPTAHPCIRTERAGSNQGVLPPALKGAQWLHQAAVDLSAACANLSVGGGIVQRKLGRMISVKEFCVNRKGCAAPTQRPKAI